jgi:hypothetical protein
MSCSAIRVMIVRLEFDGPKLAPLADFDVRISGRNNFVVPRIYILLL